jgi:stress response protein YsnF
MTSEPALPPVIGAIADDREGTALGTVTAVFLDDVTGEPTWVGLSNGLHAAPDAADIALVAPITGAEFADGRLRLAVAADAVHSAPRPSAVDRLSPDEEVTLREHYARGTSPGTSDRVATDAFPRAATEADTGTGTGTDEAMTRSEERLRVDKVTEPWVRAVLRIDTVTEEVMVPVTVTRQQARIEYLPLGATDRATGRAGEMSAGTDGTDGTERTTDWVTLYGEQPVVSVERVPIERVRLATSWVTEQQVVSDRLRHEEVELTSDVPDASPTA